MPARADSPRLRLPAGGPGHRRSSASLVLDLSLRVRVSRGCRRCLGLRVWRVRLRDPGSPAWGAAAAGGPPLPAAGWRLAPLFAASLSDLKSPRPAGRVKPLAAGGPRPGGSDRRRRGSTVARGFGHSASPQPHDTVTISYVCILACTCRRLF